MQSLSCYLQPQKRYARQNAGSSGGIGENEPRRVGYGGSEDKPTGTSVLLSRLDDSAAALTPQNGEATTA